MKNIDISELTARNEGCEALLKDDGAQHNPSVPVCMGGTALVGCNNPEACQPQYYKRTNDPSWAHVIFKNEEETRVIGITTVPRGSLLSSEINP